MAGEDKEMRLEIVKLAVELIVAKKAHQRELYMAKYNNDLGFACEWNRLEDNKGNLMRMPQAPDTIPAVTPLEVVQAADKLWEFINQ
jgi:hypothetical protein